MSNARGDLGKRRAIDSQLERDVDEFLDNLPIQALELLYKLRNSKSVVNSFVTKHRRTLQRLWRDGAHEAFQDWAEKEFIPHLMRLHQKGLPKLSGVKGNFKGVSNVPLQKHYKMRMFAQECQRRKLQMGNTIPTELLYEIGKAIHEKLPSLKSFTSSKEYRILRTMASRTKYSKKGSAELDS